MEQKHICATICDCLPTLSANHPWFVIDHDQNLLEDNNIDHVVYTMRDPPSQYRCRIPSLFLGRRIWGCFHGWVILSNHPHNDMWSLWKPDNCKIIRLPRLISKNGPGITQECCLSAPPEDPGSILMVTADKCAIVFCRLDFKRKRLRWLEMSYAKQLRSIVGIDGSVLCCLTCCNGKVYALNSAPNNFFVIHIDIVVKGRETVISLFPYLKHPYSYINGCNLNSYSFLKGCCTELFYIQLGLINVGYVEKRIVGGIHVFKLDMTKIRWEKMEDLKGAAFFFDLAHDCTMHYSPAIAPELGGYVHFLDLSGKIIHSYDFKKKAVQLIYLFLNHDVSSKTRILYK